LKRVILQFTAQFLLPLKHGKDRSLPFKFRVLLPV